MDDNGILEQIQGGLVAQAALTRPPAITSDDRNHPVEIDAGHAGLVRITFRRQKTRRAKRTRWFWSAKRAVAVLGLGPRVHNSPVKLGAPCKLEPRRHMHLRQVLPGPPYRCGV